MTVRRRLTALAARLFRRPRGRGGVRVSHWPQIGTTTDVPPGFEPFWVAPAGTAPDAPGWMPLTDDRLAFTLGEPGMSVAVKRGGVLIADGITSRSVIRRCDGTDPNLTRELTPAEFEAAGDTVTISPWDRSAPAHAAMICCQCGLVFDDAERGVIYPHPPV